MQAVKYFLVFSFLFFCADVVAQNKIVLHFTDAASDTAVSGVTIVDRYGSTLGVSDKSGYAAIEFEVLSAQEYLLAVHPGFNIDTIHTTTTNVRLRALAYTLPNVRISSSKTQKLLNFANEYVVDFDFMGDDILAVTYSGNDGRKAKLFLLNSNGDVLTTCKVPDNPVRLYKSCLGIYYCVYSDRFYPLVIAGKKITLRKPYDIKYLSGLQQCELSVNGDQYYGVGDKVNFKMVYGMIKKDDSVFKPITQFEEKEVAHASYEEYAEIMDLLEHYQFNEAARKSLLRNSWDKGSYRHISMPMYLSGDSLVIFDFFKKQIQYYGLEGKYEGSSPIGFEWNNTQRFVILKDETAREFYLHRYENKSDQTLEKLNVNNGQAAGNRILIERPFAEQVKIKDGAIYYLWKDAHSALPRQLYVQRI